MQGYVLRGVPDCLKRDAWWLSAKEEPLREGRETAKGGSAKGASGLRSGVRLPERRK